MRRVPWAAVLWPGLPYILASASVRALGVSIAAAAVLNLLIAATFLWDELLAPEVRNLGWAVLAAAWVGAAAVWLIQRRWNQSRAESDALVSFQTALEHYLRGDWFQTERLLCAILKANPEDVEARLLMATLLRHTNRCDEARRELQRLTGVPGSGAWQWEIERELALLEQRSGSLLEQVDNALPKQRTDAFPEQSNAPFPRQSSSAEPEQRSDAPLAAMQPNADAANAPEAPGTANSVATTALSLRQGESGSPGAVQGLHAAGI